MTSEPAHTLQPEERLMVIGTKDCIFCMWSFLKQNNFESTTIELSHNECNIPYSDAVKSFNRSARFCTLASSDARLIICISQLAVSRCNKACDTVKFENIIGLKSSMIIMKFEESQL